MGSGTRSSRGCGPTSRRRTIGTTTKAGGLTRVSNEDLIAELRARLQSEAFSEDELEGVGRHVSAEIKAIRDREWHRAVASMPPGTRVRVKHDARIISRQGHLRGRPLEFSRHGHLRGRPLGVVARKLRNQLAVAVQQGFESEGWMDGTEVRFPISLIEPIPEGEG